MEGRSIEKYYNNKSDYVGKELGYINKLEYVIIFSTYLKISHFIMIMKLLIKLCLSIPKWCIFIWLKI